MSRWSGPMCPIAQADGHDCPRLVDEAVPGKAAVIDDVVIGSEDAVGEPVVADERPDAKPWRRYCSAAEQARRRSLEPGKWPRRCRPSASADRAVPRGVSRAAPIAG